MFQSDLLYPQEKNEIQFSLLPVFKSQSGENRYQTEFELEYGFTDAWQLQLEWEGLIHRELFRSPGQTGAGDFSIGTQYSFMGLQDGHSHAALGLNLGVPVGDVDKGLSDGFFEIETYFTLARDFPQINGAQLFSQMGVEWVNRSRSPKTQPPYPLQPIRFSGMWEDFCLLEIFVAPWKSTGKIICGTNPAMTMYCS